MPMTYAVLLALLCRWLSIDVPKPLWTSMDLMAQGLVPTALVTFGCTVSQYATVCTQFPCFSIKWDALIGRPVAGCRCLLDLGHSWCVAQVMVILKGRRHLR